MRMPEPMPRPAGAASLFPGGGPTISIKREGKTACHSGLCTPHRETGPGTGRLSLGSSLGLSGRIRLQWNKGQNRKVLSVRLTPTSAWPQAPVRTVGNAPLMLRGDSVTAMSISGWRRGNSSTETHKASWPQPISEAAPRPGSEADIIPDP